MFIAYQSLVHFYVRIGPLSYLDALIVIEVNDKLFDFVTVATIVCIGEHDKGRVYYAVTVDHIFFSLVQDSLVYLGFAYFTAQVVFEILVTIRGSGC